MSNETNPTLAKLLGPTGEALDVVMFAGYCSPTPSRSGSLRVYRSLENLAEYVDVVDTDVVNRVSRPDGSETLWVRAEAEVCFAYLHRVHVQAAILAREIAGLGSPVSSPSQKLELRKVTLGRLSMDDASAQLANTNGPCKLKSVPPELSCVMC